MMTTRLSQLVLFSMALAVCAFPLRAANTELPEHLDGIETIDAEALIILAQGIEDLIVVDSRLAEDRGLGFIGESFNLPLTKANCTTLSRINADRERNMVIYSNGASCGSSMNALKIAQGCGYTQLYWFRGGFEEWRDKDYPYMLE